MFSFASTPRFFPLLLVGFSFLLSGAFGAHAITGVPGPVQPRREIRSLLFDYPTQWNLYVLALKAFQAEDQAHELSWYQILGIHGVPYKAWDGVKRTGSVTGYCVHSSNLFPPWHRPYVALFEQRLQFHALAIAKTFRGAKRATMVDAANRLRAPYWDWAEKPAAGKPVLPEVVTSKYISVETPTGRKTIVNPLFRYPFHPLDARIFASPWSRWHQTLRWPTGPAASASSQENKAVATLNQNAASQRSSVYQWFTNCPDYLEMSNDEAAASTPGCHISLESLHNNIHVWSGGTVQPQGHMTVIPYSAFDPLFMLHHAQVDRLFAMWQAIYPNSYTPNQKSKISTFSIKRGSIQGPKSPLKPFHRTASGEFWTPDLVRNHRVFHYTYPEFLNGGGTAKSMRAHVNRLYGRHATQHAASKRSSSPLVATNGSTYEWTANIATSRFGLNGTYTIFMFLGQPASESPVDWGFDGNLAGSYGVFSQPNMVENSIITTSAISLTSALTGKVNDGTIDALDEADVVPYLSRSLTWRISGPGGASVDPSTVPNLEISVLASTATIPSDASEFPQWSEFVAIPSITHGKPGGKLGYLGQDVASIVST